MKPQFKYWLAVEYGDYNDIVLRIYPNKELASSGVIALQVSAAKLAQMVNETNFAIYDAPYQSRKKYTSWYNSWGEWANYLCKRLGYTLYKSPSERWKPHE